MGKKRFKRFGRKPALLLTGLLLFSILPLFAPTTSLAQNYSYITQWGTLGAGAGQFNNPWGVAVDSMGNVYVGDSNNNRIQKFNTNGTTIGSWTSPAGLFNPRGLATDSSGNVYVADAWNNQVRKYNSNGTAVATWVAPGGLNTPSGVATDSQGNVYVADTLNNQVKKYDSNGAAVATWVAPGGLNAPYGVATDSQGNVYVADTLNNQVKKFDSNGGAVATWVAPGGLNAPFGVATDSSGNVYVADEGNNQIKKYDSNGTALTSWGTTGTGNSQFNSPRGVTVDWMGNVFVADTNNHRIQKFIVKSLDRLWGQTSEGTAVAISQTGWSSSQTVLLARNDHFADALAGVPLAYSLRNDTGLNKPVPLLLTIPQGLSAEAKTEIQRLGGQRVIILGGPGAVSSQVETQLLATPGVTTVERIWGQTAPGTARDIFTRMRMIANASGTTTPTRAIIATQVNFQDALAVSSPAAANNMPILLSNIASLPTETIEALSQGGITNTVIVGGGAVVSATVEADLNARGYPVLARYWGATEYETAVQIASVGDAVFSFTRPGAIFVARGDFFTDALSGGAIASRMNPAPIVLTHPGGLSTDLSSYLATRRTDITKGYILGGTGALPNNIETEIKGLLGL